MTSSIHGMHVQKNQTKRRASRKNHRKNNRVHGKVKQKRVKKPLDDEIKDIDSYIKAQKLALLTTLDPSIRRKPVRSAPAKLTLQQKRALWKITTNVSEQRQMEIEKYLKNSERGRLPMANDGADVTRPITEEQVQKFLECEDCQEHPVVYFNFKAAKSKPLCVGVCAVHWIRLSDTVIGWSDDA